MAEHLFQMISREVWRDAGGDDGQGHYEGDHHAEQTQAEIKGWKNLAASAAPEEQGCPICGAVDEKDCHGPHPMACAPEDPA